MLKSEALNANPKASPVRISGVALAKMVCDIIVYLGKAYPIQLCKSLDGIMLQ